ncbi:hypothetical protein [Thiocapsa sp.]|uniref:hypothetical protein n=1 Tax=Thiocapsa sp. TaxID=2024551 RepID=UPI0035935DBC
MRRCHVASDGANVVSPCRTSEIAAFRRVKTIISNLETAIRGTDHLVNVHKYLACDLAEAPYRISRCFDLPSLVGRLLAWRPRAMNCKTWG